MEIRIGERTDPGKVRRTNEDAFYADAGEGLFIVADGLGGHAAGEVASAMAVEEAARFFRDEGRLMEGETLLRACVDAANLKVYRESERSRHLRGMGTTLVIALVREKQMWLAHVGDSRAYLLPGDKLIQVTTDHNLLHEIGYGRRFGQYEPSRILTRAVGTGLAVEADTATLELDRGTALLCTDGLTNMLNREEIERILLETHDPQQASDWLVSAANEKRGLDNITVIVLKRP